MRNSTTDELILFVTVFLLLAFISRFVGPCSPVSRLLRSCSRKRWTCVFSTFALAMLICICFAFAHGLPKPKVHDEFAYLLLGETLRAARLSNDVHPMWQHFETFHVLQWPAYASKYPLGQGLAISLGLLIGNPIFGVWLSLASACGAICWMLQAWLKPQWAMFASLVAALRLCSTAYPGSELSQEAYWGQSYWGGAVAAFGGALLFGGLKRHANHVSWSSSLAIGGGLALLSHSRPLEGLVIAAPCLIAYVWLWSKTVFQQRPTYYLPPAIIGICLVLNLFLLGAHNLAVTGKLLQLPQTHYEQTYSSTATTLLQPIRGDLGDTASFRHDAMRNFHVGWAEVEFRNQLSLDGYFREKSRRLAHLWEFFVGPVLTFPIVAFAATRKTRWQRLTVFCASMLLATHAFTPWMHPHYVAPVAGLVYFWVGSGMAAIARSKHISRRYATILAFAVVLTIGANAALRDDQAQSDGWHERRAAIEQDLEKTNPKDLVIVRYDSAHNPHQEWVYNHADIDESHVVWARDMGKEKNFNLLKHFYCRRAWLLNVSGVNGELLDYPTPIEHSRLQVED